MFGVLLWGGFEARAWQGGGLRTALKRRKIYDGLSVSHGLQQLVQPLCHACGCLGFHFEIPNGKLTRLELGRSMNHIEGTHAEDMGKTKGLPVIEVADLLHKLLYLMGIHAF